MSTITPAQAPAAPPVIHAAPPSSTPELNDLGTRLNKDAVDTILRDPNAQESRAIMNQVRSVLKESRIKAMLQGPDAQECAKTLETIGHHLNKEHLHASLDSTTQEATNSLINNLRMKNFEHLMKAIDSDNFDNLPDFFSSSKELMNAFKSKASEMEKTAKLLSDTGDLLTKEKIHQGRTATTHALPPEPSSTRSVS